MPELCSNASSRPAGLTVHDPDRGDELAAKADEKLTQYPTHVREQITDLLRVLAAKPRLAENKVR